jgi:hypothetical protein
MIIRVDPIASEDQAWQLCLAWAKASHQYIFLCEYLNRYVLTDGDPVGSAITGCPGK